MRFLGALLWLSAFVIATDACPQSISKLCQCQVWVHGLFVNCNDQPLSRIVERLRQENSHVQRLVVHNDNITALTKEMFGDLAIRQLDLSSNGIEEVDFGCPLKLFILVL